MSPAPEVALILQCGTEESKVRRKSSELGGNYFAQTGTMSNGRQHLTSAKVPRIAAAAIAQKATIPGFVELPDGGIHRSRGDS